MTHSGHEPTHEGNRMNNWTNTHHWPTCHRSQADAGLPDGPLDHPEPITTRQRL